MRPQGDSAEDFLLRNCESAHLVNLDVALELLLQSLDGLSSLADDAAHHALGALQHARHAGAKLQDALRALGTNARVQRHR